ncbi:MAG: hypothetical protein ACOH19_12170 [Rhodoglobus sp.]
MTENVTYHKADIGNNMPLVTLYGLGVGALIVGTFIYVFASFQIADSFDVIGPLIGQWAGGALVSAGMLLVAGALVAHAINWQISRSAK